MKILFFNHFHNGDVVATKQFVQEFMSKVPAEYAYAHSKHLKVVGDIIRKADLSGAVLSVVPNNTKFRYDRQEDTFLINTWVGAYIDGICDQSDLPLDIPQPVISTEGINWKTYYRIWEYIFKVCSGILEKDLKLDGQPEDYAFSIDYTKYVSQLILPEAEESVLFSNGLVESGQNHINDDMSDHIMFFARNYPKKMFYCTKKFSTDIQNIIFTEDIFKNAGNDLNEISYLSTMCTKIVGRNSGPFLFTNTKENLNNPNKKFLALGRNYQDCFPADLKFQSDFRFVEDSSQLAVRDAIAGILA